VDKEEEIVSLKLLVGSLSRSNNNPEEPFLTIPSKGKGLKPEPKQENQASNGREKPNIDYHFLGDLVTQ
jgi:hypothetical protein